MMWQFSRLTLQMHFHMSLQVISLHKRFVAVLAFVWLNIRMRQVVFLPVRGILRGLLLPANFAH